MGKQFGALGIVLGVLRPSGLRDLRKVQRAIGIVAAWCLALAFLAHWLAWPKVMFETLSSAKA